MPIPAIDLSAIVDGQNIDASDVTTPLNNLQSGINDVLAGDIGFEQANLGASSEVTISAGVITITLTHHRVDTEANAASDDLDTINGGAEGDWLWLRLENAARVVVVKHNTGNIVLGSGGDVTLDDTNKLLVLYHNGTKWMDNSASLALNVRDLLGTAAGFDTLVLPKGIVKSSGAGIAAGRVYLDVQPGLRSRIMRSAVANGATFAFVNCSSDAVGARTKAMHSDAPYINFPTLASTNDTARQALKGSDSNYSLFRGQHNPLYYVRLRTVESTLVSLYIYLCSAQLSLDDPTTTHVLGFRYSTNAPDTHWMGIVSDGVSYQTVDTGAAVADNSKYELLCWMDSTNGIAYFSVNDSAPVTLSANLPGASQEMGAQVLIATRENVVKNIRVSRMLIEHD